MGQRGKPRPNVNSSAKSSLILSLPGSKTRSWWKSWRRLKKQKTKLSRMSTTLEWLKLKKSSDPRLAGCVKFTDLKCGTWLSTEQGLRPPRHLGGQKTYTTPLPFGLLALHFPQMTHLPTLSALLKRPLPKILPSLAICKERKSRLRSKKPSRTPP